MAVCSPARTNVFMASTAVSVLAGSCCRWFIAKPSRMIHVGDTILVRKPPVTYSFRVLALTENRLGAKLVPEYLENITPKEQYDLLDVIRISGFIDRRKGLGRPTKREGRELARFTDDIYTGPSSQSWQAEDGWDFDFDEDDFND